MRQHRPRSQPCWGGPCQPPPVSPAGLARPGCAPQASQGAPHADALLAAHPARQPGLVPQPEVLRGRSRSDGWPPRARRLLVCEAAAGPTAAMDRKKSTCACPDACQRLQAVSEVAQAFAGRRTPVSVHSTMKSAWLAAPTSLTKTTVPLSDS